MKKPVIGITEMKKPHPDDDIMMSYAAKGFVEGVKDAGGIPIILPLVIKKWLPITSVSLISSSNGWAKC